MMMMMVAAIMVFAMIPQTSPRVTTASIGGPSPPFLEETQHRPPAQQHLKTLVILIGNLRGGEVTWQSLYDHVLDPNEADLALVIGKANTTTKTSLYRRAKYLYEFPEYDNDWAPAVDEIDGPSWRTTVLPYLTPTDEWSSFLGGVAGILGSGVIHFMARYYAQQMILQHNLTFHYDRFVVTRSDHYYKCRHDLTLLDNQHVWVPTEEDYKGICDRHVVCNSSVVHQVLNVLPPLIQTPQLYLDTTPNLRHYNPEKFLQLVWSTTGIHVLRFDRVMFTLKLDAVDGTRGRTAHNTVVSDAALQQQGLRIKYEQEYYAARCTCRGLPLRNNHRATRWLFWLDDRICFADTPRNRRWLLSSSSSP